MPAQKKGFIWIETSIVCQVFIIPFEVKCILESICCDYDNWFKGKLWHYNYRSRICHTHQGVDCKVVLVVVAERLYCIVRLRDDIFTIISILRWCWKVMIGYMHCNLQRKKKGHLK
mgnify:CR=1 FL=1